MEWKADSTYEDSFFEQGNETPQANAQKAKQHNDLNIKSTKTNQHSHQRKSGTKDTGDEEEGDTTLPVVDTTLDMTIDLPETRNSKQQPTSTVNDTNNDDDDDYDDDVFEDGDGEMTDKNAENKNNDKKYVENRKVSIKPGESIFKSSKTENNKSSVYETDSSPIKTRTSQETQEAPQSRYLRQDSDLISESSSDYELRDVNNAEDTYISSGFPSLLSYLGPNATNRTLKIKKKKQKETVETNKKSPAKVHVHKERLSFTEEMKKRNESQWMRIEAVAKEKMELYERYAVDMTLKIKRQREQINRRSQELLTSLARIEEKKREDKLYDSPHGRMWRHHRSMQRRVFNLEPMSTKDKRIMPNSAKSKSEVPDE